MKTPIISSKITISIFMALVVAFSLSCEKDNDDSGSSDNGSSNQSAHKKGTGASAEALLTSDKFGALEVEIQYVKGYKPTDEALDSFKHFLNENLHKPDGIEFIKTAIPEPGNAQYSIEKISDIEDENRTVFNQDNTIGVYFLFVDGEYEEDTENRKTLGVAYHNTSMVIFEETLQEMSGGVGQPSKPSRDKIENAVINHEMGHNLGLVANGTPMQNDHQEESKGKHCIEDSCLMHWTVRTGDVVETLLGGTVPELDSDCRADLKANGGK